MNAHIGEERERVSVLVVDDHPVVREGLRTLLGSLPGFSVVGEASSGNEAVEKADELQPDIVIMDLHMGDGDGISATRRLVSHSPHVAVLVLTMFDDDNSLFAALRAGARGYILKGAAQEDIVRALEALTRGEAIFSPGIARQVLAYFGSGPRPGGESLFPELTGREREVLDLIARGTNNLAIAERLGLTPKTVRNHVSNIFNKLHVTDRAQAIVRAREAGLGGSAASTP